MLPLPDELFTHNKLRDSHLLKKKKGKSQVEWQQKKIQVGRKESNEAGHFISDLPP